MKNINMVLFMISNSLKNTQYSYNSATFLFPMLKKILKFFYIKIFNKILVY